MPTFTPDRFIVEKGAASGTAAPDVTEWISEAGGLTRFGAFIEVLQPGSRSSIKHWHSDEDEMVYVLEGEVCVVEGSSETVLSAGSAATFRAGMPVAHQLVNRSAAATRCLVVGTRAAVDSIHYPDHDRICLRDRSLPDDVWTDGDGKPASNPYRD